MRGGRWAPWRGLGLLLIMPMPFAAIATAQDSATAVTSADAWRTWVIAQLKLDAPQQTAFLAYEASMSQQPALIPSVSAEQYLAMTAPQRVDFLAQQMDLDAARVRSRAEVIHRFYAVLSPEQQSQFDKTMSSSGGEHASVAPDTQPLPPGPPPNDFTSPSHTEPAWLVMPSAENIERVYPSDARRKHLTGHLILHCTADADGYIADCTVAEETPKDEGFGNAALEITAYMRMKPATRFGIPVPSQLNIPVKFAF